MEMLHACLTSEGIRTRCHSSLFLGSTARSPPSESSSFARSGPPSAVPVPGDHRSAHQDAGGPVVALTSPVVCLLARSSTQLVFASYQHKVMAHGACRRCRFDCR